MKLLSILINYVNIFFMLRKPEIILLTISKYPPYMSGHAIEAMNQNRAAWEITGNRPHELTYGLDVYAAGSNYNPNPALLTQSENVATVHRLEYPQDTNVKVADGELNKAMAGLAIVLVKEHGANVISTFYLDPFALIANQVKNYAENVLGQKNIIVAHKAVGSDVLNSIRRHHEDGQAELLLGEYLKGDLQLAVSQFTKIQLVESARQVLPKSSTDKLEQVIQVLYAPINTEFFAMQDTLGQQAFRAKYGIAETAEVVSYFGRLFPEKNVETLIRAFDVVKRHRPNAVLVIGGQGNISNDLVKLAFEQRTPDIIFTGGVSEEEKRALMQTSTIGVIPTKPIDEFVETLCISAIEYQAAGTPLITTEVGGVPEAAGEHSIYVDYNSVSDVAETIEAILSNREKRSEMIGLGMLYVAKFNYKRVTDQFLTLVTAASERQDLRRNS